MRFPRAEQAHPEHVCADTTDPPPGFARNIRRLKDLAARPLAAVSAASRTNWRRMRVLRYSQAATSPANAPPPYTQRGSMPDFCSASPTSAEDAATAR